MKFILLRAFSFLAIGCLFQSTGLAADTNPPPRLTVELRDGSRVVGESGEKNFKFRSDLLGEIKLPVTDVRAVEWAATNSARLATVNGDSLKVAWVNSAIPVKTSFGRVDLATAAIRRLTVAVVPAPGSHPPGLVALWSGEGEGKDAVGNNDAILKNIAFVNGKFGRAFSFNGNDSYLQIPANPSLNVGAGDGFTLAAWINPATPMMMPVFEYERFLGTSDGADVGVQLYINARLNVGPEAGCLGANLKDVNGADHFIATPADQDPVVAGRWQQVVLTYDQLTGVAALYCNGDQVARENLGRFTPQTGFANLLLGARTTFGSAANPREKFSGLMDQISIYNRALTATEVQAGKSR